MEAPETDEVIYIKKYTRIRNRAIYKLRDYRCKKNMI